MSEANREIAAARRMPFGLSMRRASPSAWMRSRRSVRWYRGPRRSTASAMPDVISSIRTSPQVIDANATPDAVSCSILGGGAGIHAFWLAQRGYQVHLIDPVELQLEEARSHGTVPFVADAIRRAVLSGRKAHRLCVVTLRRAGSLAQQ